MDKNENEIKQEIAKKLSLYIPVIKEKFGEYMNKDIKDKLSNIKNFEDLIAFDYSGNVTAWANHSKITLPMGASKAFDFIKTLPNAGTQKDHKTYTSETLIENDNTFEDYIKHLIVTNADILTYFNDLLLHETMHLCGSHGSGTFGAGAFREGLNEYLTRLVAKENGFQTSGCGYPKEIKMVLEMEKVLGTKALTQIAFLKDMEEINDFLNKSVGIEKTKLFNQVASEMEKEFRSKYFSKVDSYVGFEGAIKKAKNYGNIDYSKASKLIEEFQNNCELE